MLINWSAQQTADQGALTRFTWANAIYLLPYAVLAAPLLQLSFPRLATAAEQGRTEVGQVLAETGPATVVMAWLGAALLVGTAVPVARVFVLGPGSGDTEALAWPIVAFAPAIVGFTLLGLASRTLLAQHLGKASGIANAMAWGAVIISVALLRLVVPADWLVPALAGSVSLGMVVGAAAGWALLRRSGMSAVGLGRPMLVSLAAAVLAGGVSAAGSQLFADVGLVAAVLGAVAAALLCVAVFAGDAATSGTCAARAALGAAAAYTFGRGGLIMKIAQLLTASTGGIGRHVASIAPRLERRGHQIRVFCPKVTAEAQGFKELGLDVWPLTSQRRFIGADLVHAHGLKAGWLGIPIAWMFKVPLVVTWHNAVLGDGLMTATVRQMQRAVAMGADLTLAREQRSCRSSHTTRSPERAAVTDCGTGAATRQDQPRRAATGSRCWCSGHGRTHGQPAGTPEEPWHVARHRRGRTRSARPPIYRRRRWAGARYVAAPHHRRASAGAFSRAKR